MIWNKLVGFTFAVYVAAATDLRFSEELASDFVFSWDYDKENITIQLEAPTSGWVGIGFSITNTMRGADLIFAGIHGGRPYAWDAWSPVTGVVEIDSKQDVEIISGVERDNRTTVRVKRPLSGTGLQDNNITISTVNVIWAFGKADKSKTATRSDYHGSDRGYLEMVLLKDKSSPRDEQAESSTTAVSTIKLASSTSYKSPEIRTTLPPSDEKASGSNAQPDFPFSIALDIDQTVHLSWNFDEKFVTCQLTAPSVGWIGIGFSYTSSMRGADLIIMGKTTRGIYAVDTHADKNTAPDVDESQDVEIISGFENGTHTSITFKRKRQTCDENDLSLKDGTYRIIWAYGERDLVNEYPDRVDYHGANRGAKSLKLINRVPHNVKGISNDFFDIVSDNFTVPALDTFYLCKAIEIPNPTRKRHIVRIAPNLQPGNERKVHHIIVYLCDGEVDQKVVGKDLECYKQVNPWSVGCVKTLAGWAVGMSDIIFPQDVGFPIGGEKSKYVMLQTHYDNPELRAFQDNSGMRFYYTENLRPIDGGLLTISATLNSIWAPPETDLFRVTGHCSELCLARGMNGSGADEFTVIGTALHSHLAGRKLVLHHYRDGKELKPFAKEDHYDFDYQETQYVDDGTVKIKKGDSFAIDCYYDTSGRDKVLTGGLTTRDEMCNAFLIYYPLMKLDFCDSSPKLFYPSSLLQLAAALNISLSFEEGINLLKRIRKNPYTAMKVLATVLDSVKWTEKKKILAENFMNNLNQLPTCIAAGSQLMDYYGDEFPSPKYEEYIKETECELKGGERSSYESFPTMTIVGTSTMLIILIGAGLIYRKS